jgi:hypothetical protein
MRLTDHVALNFSNNMWTSAVFLDIDKAFDTTWHSSPLYKLSELRVEFSTSLINLIPSFSTDTAFKVLVVLALVLCSLYINDVTVAPGTQLALFADDTCIYATEKHKRRVLCKLQRGLTAVNSWYERWNIKINEGKTQSIYEGDPKNGICF